MKRLGSVLLIVCMLLTLCACGEQGSVAETVHTTAAATEAAEPATDWEVFRAYLQENGDAVVDEDLSTDGDSLTRKTVIKGKDHEIRIRFEMHLRQNVNGIITTGEVTAQMSFPENAQTVDVEFKTKITASQGGKSEVASYEGFCDWDISQFAEGDDVVGTATYNYIDENGNYTHKDETVGYKITGIIEPVTDALRKSLSESGLGLTMADLGFVNY